MYQNRVLQEKGTTEILSTNYRASFIPLLETAQGGQMYKSSQKRRVPKCTTECEVISLCLLTHVKNVNIKTIDFLPSKNNQQIEARKNA